MTGRAIRPHEYVAGTITTQKRRRVRASRRKARIVQLPDWFDRWAWIPRSSNHETQDGIIRPGITHHRVPDPLGDLFPTANLNPPEGVPEVVKQYPALVARLNDAIEGYRAFGSRNDVEAMGREREHAKLVRQSLERFEKAGRVLSETISDALARIPGAVAFIGAEGARGYVERLGRETNTLKFHCEVALMDSTHRLSIRRKQQLEREIGFLLAVYGVPLAVSNSGAFAQTMEVVLRESHLEHVLSGGTPDFRKSLKREKARWTRNAVESERQQRADHRT